MHSILAVGRRRDVAWLLSLVGLTAAMVGVQGYHPLAEDGGLYVAGVEWLLDPRLFPRYTSFVTEHLRFSVFAPVVAEAVRGTGMSLAWVLVVGYVASVGLTLVAGRMVLRRCGFGDAAQLVGVALLAMAATVPVAGTSLLLVDPYVTARSVSTPLTLLAVAWAMDAWGWRACVGCVAAMAVAAAFHPLMAVYGAAVVVLLRLLRLRRWRVALGVAALVAIAVAAVVQAMGVPDAAAGVQAAYSRYYWFLSQWQWFEWLGLVGPVVVLALLRGPAESGRRRLVVACMFVGGVAVVVAGLFARRDVTVHAVARLQPLRVFLLLYAVMLLLLGAAMGERLRRLRWLAAVVIVAVGVTMFTVQRQTFPASVHVEWPGRVNPNAWVRAFVWARENTPADAVFALDASYVNAEGEDAQTFRATAERSAVPDFSKDGGEAAITPALAEAWWQGARAQVGLSDEGEAERVLRLREMGVTWVVLRVEARTGWVCPYANEVVKVCGVGR